VGIRGAWPRVALLMKPGCGPTVQGLLMKRTRREYVLFNAELLQDEQTTHELAPGPFTVPRENVYGWQEIR
jgi:hypothetical protein